MKPDYFKGRGAQIKPKNQFLKQSYVTEHIEGLDEPLLVKEGTQVYYDSPKKIVNKIESPDLRSSYSLNPYQGCEHGCIYCYARNSHEYYGFSAGLDFEQKIIVKKKAPILLEQHLLKKTWNAHPIMLSGNTDCYQPLERKYKLTRQLLKVFLKYQHPVSILTKNALVTRDIDILQELAKNQLVHVFFSINTLDEKMRTLLEPRTASASKKLLAMKQLAEAGILVGVMNAPIIPGINHHEIPSVIKTSADHGALAAGYTVVRLNGAIGDIFSDWLKKNFPDRFDKVLNQIQELHGGQVNDTKYGRRIVGEGNIALIIKKLFDVAKKKYMNQKLLPPLNTTAFRKGGNYTLF